MRAGKLGRICGLSISNLATKVIVMKNYKIVYLLEGHEFILNVPAENKKQALEEARKLICGQENLEIKQMPIPDGARDFTSEGLTHYYVTYQFKGYSDTRRFWAEDKEHAADQMFDSLCCELKFVGDSFDELLEEHNKQEERNQIRSRLSM